MSRDFRDRAATARDSRTTPGLYASLEDVRAAQQAAVRWASTQDDPARAIADEREVRYRVLLRSTVYWVIFGIPGVLALLQLLATCIAGVAANPGLRP